MAENNLTTTNDFKKPISIDVTNKFKENLEKFLELIGITQKIPVSEGMVLKTYKLPTGTLQSGDVAEGETIPLSKFTPQEGETIPIALKKYRKATTGEAIQKFGEDAAITDTDEAMLRAEQKRLRTEFTGYIKQTPQSITKLSTLQAAAAHAWGKLQILFEDFNPGKAVVLVNPLDLAEHIGTTAITTQTAFGAVYLDKFTNLTYVTSSDVEEGVLYATVPENIKFAYIDARNSTLSGIFGLTSDALGLVGMTHYAEKGSLTLNTVMVSGTKCYTEMPEGVLKIKFKNVG